MKKKKKRIEIMDFCVHINSQIMFKMLLFVLFDLLSYYHVLLLFIQHCFTRVWLRTWPWPRWAAASLCLTETHKGRFPLRWLQYFYIWVWGLQRAGWWNEWTQRRRGNFMLCNALNSADSGTSRSVNSSLFQRAMNMDSVVPHTPPPTHTHTSTY